MTDPITTTRVSELAFSEYMRQPQVVNRFASIVGGNKNALRFIQSVILLVESDDKPGEYNLKRCTKQSILKCALKAVVHGVTVNPEDRQAFIIPYKDKGVVKARFQLHYQELLNRAVRTNRYTTLNVSPIFEGEVVYQDVITGKHKVEMDNGLMTEGACLRPVTEDSEKKRIGWLGYLRTTKGFERTFYISINEIMRRKSFNKGSESSFAWKDHAFDMERKTALRELLKNADIGEDIFREVNEIEREVYDDENFDIEAFEGSQSEEPITAEVVSAEQSMKDLGF